METFQTPDFAEVKITFPFLRGVSIQDMTVHAVRLDKGGRDIVYVTGALFAPLSNKALPRYEIVRHENGSWELCIYNSRNKKLHSLTVEVVLEECDPYDVPEEIKNRLTL